MRQLIICTWFLAICTASCLGAIAAPQEISSGQLEVLPPAMSLSVSTLQPVQRLVDTTYPGGGSADNRTTSKANETLVQQSAKLPSQAVSSSSLPPLQPPPQLADIVAVEARNSTYWSPISATVDHIQAVTVSGGSGDVNSPRPVQLPAPSGWQVVCNSRCECLVVEFGPSLNGVAKQGTTSSNNEASETLIAFSEDYSLDYDDHEERKQQQQQQQQQDDNLADGGPSRANEDKPPAGNTTSGTTISAESLGSNGSQLSLSAAGLANQSSGPTIVGRNVAENNNNTTASKLIIENPNNREKNSKEHQTIPSDQQLTGGQQQPPPQLLYAQSLYSSNPKLSFHAHVPHYLKSQVSQGTMTTALGNDPPASVVQTLPANNLGSNNNLALAQPPAATTLSIGHQQPSRLSYKHHNHHHLNQQQHQQQLQPHHLHHLSHPIAATNPRLLVASADSNEFQLQSSNTIQRLVPLRTLDLANGQLMMVKPIEPTDDPVVASGAEGGDLLASGDQNVEDQQHQHLTAQGSEQSLRNSSDQTKQNQQQQLADNQSSWMTTLLESKPTKQKQSYVELNHQLAERIHAYLIRIQTEGIQSLSLRNNNLKFEQFVQLYAILALGPMRRQLYHLNLAHNSLIKLGVAFTGFIEHNLSRTIARLQQQQKSTLTWPFVVAHSSLVSSNVVQMATNQSKSSTVAAAAAINHQRQLDKTNQQQQQQPLNVQNVSDQEPSQLMMMQQQNEISKQQQKLFASNGSNKLRFRLPNLGDGLLFNLIVERILASNNNSLSALYYIPTNHSTHLQQTSQNYLNQHHPFVISTPPPAAATTTSSSSPSAASFHYLQIRALDLSYNKLKWLINDQFRALKQLQSIRLDHNRISFIHQQAFQGLEALRYINLNYNRIQTIHVEQFQTNYNLLSLSLRANYLAYLRAGSFASLSSLKRLDLSKNKFTILSNNALVGLDTLEQLNLSSNQFVHVPSASLHPLTSLIKLDLSDNQLAQLVPGTFFHLPICELWLNKNELLVVIDRGAFWDLPYLRQLHLGSNPMLMNINSQAFVGTQNLQLIDVEHSDRIDQETKQMLDNITMAATSRQLRFEQLQQQQRQQLQPNQSTIDDRPANRVQASSLNQSAQMNTHNTIISSNSSAHSIIQAAALLESGQQSQKQIGKSIVRNNLNYIQSLGLIVLLVVALKFVFKYTSTRRYMETRRRARRVYEANPGVTSAGSDSLSCSISGSISNNDNDDENGVQSVWSRSSLDNGGNCLNDDHLDINVISLSSLGVELVSRQRQGVESNSDSFTGQVSFSADETSSTNGDSNGDRQITSGVMIHETGLGGFESSSTDMNTEKADSSRVIDTHLSEEDCHLEMETTNSSHNVETESSTYEDSNVITMNVAASGLDNFCPNCPSEIILNKEELVGNDNVDDCGKGEFVCLDQHNSESTCYKNQHNVTGSRSIMMNDDNPHNSPVTHSNSSHTMTTTNVNNQTPTANTLDLIHSHLVAAGFDYGHANCLHFYQSIEPAIQFADLTANYVNQMDYY